MTSDQKPTGDKCPVYARKTPMIPWHNWGWFGGKHCIGCGYRP